MANRSPPPETSKVETVIASLNGFLDGNVQISSPDTFDRFQAPPAIRWDIASENHLPPRRLQGGGLDEGPVWTRDVLVAFTIWGRNVAEAEQLLETLVAAAHRQFTHHSYALEGAQWDTGSASEKGAICVLNMRIRLPILRFGVATKKLTDVPVSKEFETP